MREVEQRPRTRVAHSWRADVERGVSPLQLLEQEEEQEEVRKLESSLLTLQPRSCKNRTDVQSYDQTEL